MISRRDFLQRAAATAASLSLNPLQGVNLFDDVYENVRLRLTTTKPQGWVYSSIADFAALRDKSVLEDVLAGEPHALRDPSQLPVFLMENEHYRDGEFAPCIAMYDSEHKSAPPSDIEAAHHNMLLRFANSYKELEIEAMPQCDFTDAFKFTRATWSYLHVIEGMEPIPLKVISLLTFRPERVHTYYLVDHSESQQITSDVWDEFVNHIQYADQQPLPMSVKP